MPAAADEAFTDSLYRALANISVATHGDFARNKRFDVFVRSYSGETLDASVNPARADADIMRAPNPESHEDVVEASPLDEDFRKGLTSSCVDLLRQLVNVHQLSICKAPTLTALPDFATPANSGSDPVRMWQALARFDLRYLLIGDFRSYDISHGAIGTHVAANLAMNLFTGQVRFSTLAMRFFHITQRVRVARDRKRHHELIQVVYRDSCGVLHAEHNPDHIRIRDAFGDGGPSDLNLFDVVKCKRVPKMLCLSDYRFSRAQHRVVYAFGLSCDETGTSIEALFYTFPERMPPYLALALIADTRYLKNVCDFDSYAITSSPDRTCVNS
jgi:hypothetical protein